MPLIIITGFPCTGKTTFAKKLQDAIANTQKYSGGVHLVNEESEVLGTTKAQCYETSLQEKFTRAAIRSAVSHKVSTEAMVIADSNNYIKGFRYELYCTARSYRTPHCVVWVECKEEVSDSWNANREDKYPKELMSELRQRFEAPNEKNRWDFPLFKVNMTPMSEISNNIKNDTVSTQATTKAESIESVFEKLQVAVEAPKAKSAWKPKTKAKQNVLDANNVTTINTINNNTDTNTNTNDTTNTNCISNNNNNGVALSFSGTTVHNEFTAQGEDSDVIISRLLAYFDTAIAPAPHASTVVTQHSSAEMLYELDHTSKVICDRLMLHQNNSSEGTPLVFTEYQRTFTLHRTVGLSELQRHRRQFVKVNSMHPPESVQEIGSSFIDFLGSQI